jgi:fumarylacetoacetate (FAA) hydrolase
VKLATLKTSRPDGALVLVSPDGARFLEASDCASTLQAALENWPLVEPRLRALSSRLTAGEGHPLRADQLAAPLPRAWQWLDGSAYRSHGELMERLFNAASPPPGKPLMYQGMSHQFLSATDDVPLPREEDGIDFEGEFGVVTDAVPMGVSADRAMQHIRLIVQINDWSLRALAPAEMKTGFGWIQAKPACSMAPFAVTPDELGVHWRDGRVHLRLLVDWNGKRFGAAEGGAMEFGFHELIAHAASTRSLPAGTIIGSGTVSNANYREIGSSCIAELRAIELMDTGAPQTGFMRFGDRVRMEAVANDGSAPFGAIDQTIVRAT